MKVANEIDITQISGTSLANGIFDEEIVERSMRDLTSNERSSFFQIKTSSGIAQALKNDSGMRAKVALNNAYSWAAFVTTFGTIFL